MEKEFIPYEQALSLKELGFDEECLTQSKHKKLCSNKEQPGGCQLHNLHCAYPDCTIDKTVESIPLPLYQQAFRWFREKHNILANVYANASGFLYQWEDAVGGTHRGFSDFEGPNDSGVWDTYEEAELACIDKLIELVKEAKEL